VEGVLPDDRRKVYVAEGATKNRLYWIAAGIHVGTNRIDAGGAALKIQSSEVQKSGDPSEAAHSPGNTAAQRKPKMLPRSEGS
jgi:hypothetical protein